METIPILDLSKLTNYEDKELSNGSVHLKNDLSWTRLGRDMRKVLGEIGFVQLINHGIPEKNIAHVFNESKKFFNLPQEVKNKCAKKMENMDMEHWYGYTHPGQENLNYKGVGSVFEFRETYDWLEGKGVYPDEEVPQFNQSLDKLHEDCKLLAKKVLRLWALGLGLEDQEFFIKKHQHWIHPEKFTGLTNIRLAHYPKISEEVKIPPNSVRIHEHSDLASLTFIFQKDVGGLELKNTHGEWIPVNPIPDAVVLNTGDLLEFWTSGLLPATPHRILIPDSESTNRQSRYSVAYFSGPDTEAEVVPLDIDFTEDERKRIEESGKKYSQEPISAGEYAMNHLKYAVESSYLKKE